MLNQNRKLSLLFSGLPLFVFSFIAITLFYWSANKAVLIDDGISGIWEIQTQGWNGYIHSYGIKGFYYGHYGFLALFYFLFRLNTILWFLLLVAIHALNTTLIQSVFRRLYEQLKLPHAQWISLFGGLLFLLSPFQLENITWAATLHYNLCLLMLLSMTWLVEEVEMSIGKQIGFYGLFALSLITLEVSFFFPILILLFIFSIQPKEKNETYHYWKRKLRVAFLPMISLLLIYILAYYYKNHSWIPSREDTAMSIHWNEVITHLGQYLLKQLGLVHFLPYEKRSYLYELCLHWKRTAVVILSIASLILGMLFYFKRERLKSMLFLWMSYLIISFPFLLFYFMYLFRYENDRYQYFGSVFLLQSISLLLFCFGKKAGIVLTSMLLLIYIYFIPEGVESKAVAVRLHENIIQTIPRPQNNEHYYFLNLPNYCADHYEFRANYRLPIALEATYHQNYSQQLTILMYYYGKGEHDSFAVVHPRTNCLELQSKTNGIWWMYESLGASSYENDVWKVNMKEWSVEFEMKRPLRSNEKVYLFSDGRFSIVPMN